MAAGRSLEDIRNLRMLELSLTRLVELVGEAGTKVSDDFRKAHPAIPWKAIVGMRHKLIHGYDRVDLEILFLTVRRDLPALIPLLAAALKGAGRTSE